MIKLAIPKEKPEDVQEYVLIEEVKQGPRTVRNLRIVSEPILSAEKQAIQNQITELQAKALAVDSAMSSIKK